jgi:hypothetical protein
MIDEKNDAVPRKSAAGDVLAAGVLRGFPCETCGSVVEFAGIGTKEIAMTKSADRANTHGASGRNIPVL